MRVTPELVLVVDDDPFMLDMMPGTLQEIFPVQDGAKIMSAASPEAALRILEETDCKAIVVLSDYDLRSGMDGLELLARVARRCPSSVRVLFSGHSAAEIGPMNPRVVHGFIEKPFRLREMLAPLRDIIASAAAG